MMVPQRPPCPRHALVLALVCLLFPLRGSLAPAPAPAPAPAQAKTDPIEVISINTIFNRWNLNGSAAGWNTTGDPCSGIAINNALEIRSITNAAIKCKCNYKNQTVCHITQLKVYQQNVRGSIPEELKNLKYLWDLNLGQNYLTGHLPAFVGILTEMQYFSVGFNALSGPVPKELGNLQKLISLGINGNNFSGTLPSELGNMSSLEQLYIDSCSLSGEIPGSYSKLKNMKILRASDNDFTGKIPDLIGTWTKLTVLMLQGNSFQGPIPSSLANLTLLEDLRIGEILNGSSSLEFVTKIKTLNTLVLRNSKISDSIPSNIGELTALQLLDLSFNNLTGKIPTSLFSIPSLTHLFLGNNSLSGSLPTEKITSLQNIDLSYNELSGEFPAWVTESNLKLNLVANNFMINSSNSVLPSEFSCLQRDIPCNRGSPIYSSFGINCGGRSIRSADGILYEADDQNLTTASYYVTETKKWGVSSVGFFKDSPNGAIFTWNEVKEFNNTLDSELFQTARLSPSSLRYYGLGLEIGNYTVKLQFAETAFPENRTWKSTGRRIFDIYIQGILKEKDFDIRKEAGGTSFSAVMKVYTVPVTSNFLEIHFFWAGKGTCCIPIQSYYGPAISAISVSPKDFTPASRKKNKTAFIVGITVGVAAFLFLFVLGIFIWRKWRKRLGHDDDEELLDISSRAGTFSYAELQMATEDFNPANKLGEGGFGPVFKGKLSDGRVVAVKQLSVPSHHGKRQFVTEVAIISTVQHRNLVKLYGCCFEGNKRLLVYEYLQNNSLDQALFGKNKIILDWPTRFDICLGTARGLAYLHEESRDRIVHRDVKASNILLDADLNPKISDFGLAKLYDDKMTHISTRVAGTVGYLAPEYALMGHLTEKADVFGFGVVALEILSGRPNWDASSTPEKIYPLERAWRLHENKQELDLVDPTLSSYNKEEALRIIGVSLLCTQASPSLRPAMSRVVAMLVGDTEVSDVTSRPGYLTEWQFDDRSTGFMTDEFSKSSTVATGSSTQVTMSSNQSSTFGPEASPNDSHSILHEFVGEGGR